MDDSFYSSPSCDGDHPTVKISDFNIVSILPRLATGILPFNILIMQSIVSILPRLATGIDITIPDFQLSRFLFFPVLRRGSHNYAAFIFWRKFLFFPVLRRGSKRTSDN